MSPKSRFKKVFLNPISKVLRSILSVTPSSLRSIALRIISDSFRSRDGLIRNKAFFDLDLIQGLEKTTYYSQTYINSISKASQQKTDNIYKILRHHNLYSYIDSVLNQKIPGHFAECGTWNGNSLFATLSLLDNHPALAKNIYVYDSFEDGLSKFSKEDFQGGTINTDAEAEFVRKSFYSSYDLLIDRLDNNPSVFVKKGWIPDVFVDEPSRTYSFVHIDVDLYEPTFAAHQYFFPKMSPGGIVVCDDYGYKSFPGAAAAVDKFLSSLPPGSYSHFFRLSMGTSVLIK